MGLINDSYSLVFSSCCLSLVLSACSTLSEAPVVHKPQHKVPSKVETKSEVVTRSSKATKASAAGKNSRPVSGEITSPSEAGMLSFRQDLLIRNYPAALADSDIMLQSPGLSAMNFLELFQGRVISHEALGDLPGSILDAQTVILNPILIKESEAVKNHAIETIEGRMNQEQLEKMEGLLSANSLKTQVLFRLGQFSLDTKDHEKAQKYFARLINIEPNSDLGHRAQELLTQLEAARRVEPKTIGVVLPLTGKHASIAQKTLRGVQMGLGLYGRNISTFKLAVVDSEGNPDTARKGVERLVKEDNVISIIGSVLSKTASGVASKSAELGVPSITLSQKSGLTELGPNVFRNALTSEMQVRYLAKVAVDDLGLKRFAVLYPNDQYGVEYTNIFWDEVLARGGSITSAQVYSPKETDFRLVIQRLIGTFYLEDRAEEYKARLKDWSEQQSKRSGRNTPPEDLLPPVVDFDAIFIPDSAKSLGQVAAMLAYSNVHGVKLLGTNLWNVPGLAKRAGNSAKDIVFVDSFSSSDPAFQNSSFVREYKSLFGEEPGVFEIQGYDSALILRQLIAAGNTSRESLSQALNKLQNFSTALGKVSVTPEREILRPLGALTLENNEIVPLRTRGTP